MKINTSTLTYNKGLKSPLSKGINIFKVNIPFYIMLLPGIIWYIVFKYVPMYGAVIAFKDYNISEGIIGSSWSDPLFKNFMTLFNSPYFVQVLSNTLIISVYKIVFAMLPPLILALLISECSVGWFKRLVQTITYMPHFLSWVIIYGIMMALFSQGGGLVNYWIVEAGGKSIPFLSSSEWFRSFLVGSDIWQSAGWGAIIYLASITSIDESLYEAAILDGCTRLKRIWYITLPSILGVFFLLLVLKIGGILDAGFDQVFIMYNINVYDVGDIIDTWVYRTGMSQLNFSLASAVGLFKSVIGMILMITANYLSGKFGDRSIW